jgi:hypothetical protein
MLGAAALVWGAVGSSAFAIRDVEVDGASLTGDADVRAALALSDRAPSAFTVATDTLRDRVMELPAVEDADVRVGLPGTILVRVEEREPVLAWRLGDALLLIDRAGRVIADATAPGASAAAEAARGLPAIVDRRAEVPGLAIGSTIDGLEFDVATRLRSLTGADVGSTASEIIVEVDDDDGWTVSPAVDEPWVAVFGFYGPEIRPPTMIPEQVRLLRTLLLGQGEGTILRAILAGERAGTFIGREEP